MKIWRKRMNESMSDGGDCRTAPATPGLLKIDEETKISRGDKNQKGKVGKSRKKVGKVGKTVRVGKVGNVKKK
jgi:hypothetical protein